MAPATRPWSRATMNEEPETSAMSNSCPRKKRQWRVVESIAVRIVRSIPSGATLPSFNVRMIS